VYDYLLLFKPFNVLCQFSAHEGKRTLADVLPPTTPRDVYPVGRLDYDSEGFVLLTNDTAVNHRMLDPAHEHEREYLVQVEGEVTEEGLSKLREGGLDLNLGQGKTHRSRPCPIAECITLPEGEEAPPGIGLREPPIRARKFIPTSWLRLGMTEGKNRQVRRMMAMVGFPCLRLVRWRVEKLDVAGLVPGEMRVLTREETYEKLKL
jgi:23S rRNA pseudouridine2457 synthase